MGFEFLHGSAWPKATPENAQREMKRILDGMRRSLDWLVKSDFQNLVDFQVLASG